MSRWLRVATVLAAAAFVVAFRLHAGHEQAEPASAAAPLSAARASALESDTRRSPAKPALNVRLAQVAALPKLGRVPAAKVEAQRRKEAAARKARAERRKAAEARKQRAAAARKKREAAARKRAAAKPRAVAPPSATPVPQATPVYRPPVSRPQAPPPKPGGSYVGKDFDSEG